MHSRYEIMSPESGVLHKWIRASNITEAVEKFAHEQDPQLDYKMLNGNKLGFLIRFNNSDSPFKYFSKDPERDCLGEWQYFEVRGKSVPSYNAVSSEIPTGNKLWQEILDWVEDEGK